MRHSMDKNIVHGETHIITIVSKYVSKIDNQAMHYKFLSDIIHGDFYIRHHERFRDLF